MLATPTKWGGLVAAEYRAAVNIIGKPSVSKARYCTKLNKEVSDDLFQGSCCSSLTTMGPCHVWLCSYMAEFPEPYLCKYSVLEATKQCRGMICLCRKVKLSPWVTILVRISKCNILSWMVNLLITFSSSPSPSTCCFLGTSVGGSVSDSCLYECSHAVEGAWPTNSTPKDRET